MKRKIAALFDLDGVIVDTECQYGRFWKQMGEKLRIDVPDFHQRIKGNTLKQIFDLYFHDQLEIQQMIRDRLIELEKDMTFPFIPGVVPFLESLREHAVCTAIVTSSDSRKMENLYRAHPDLNDYFEVVITADQVTRSKPDPQCYLLAASELGISPEDSFVFEDSLAGIDAGKAARMTVIGLATTYPKTVIENKADLVIPDFCEFSYPDLISLCC